MDVAAAHAAVQARYEAFLAEHGPDDSRGVGWSSAWVQTLRFEVLCQVMEGEAPVSVADFGCGTGALFAHLAARGTPPPLGEYAGYDLVPGMIAAARAAIDDPRARFAVGTEVAEDVDYVIACGALTMRPGIPDDAWAEHVRDVVRGLWERARRGLAFNLISREVPPTDRDLYCGDPDEWAQWTMRELPGARVALVRTPPLPDFAVLVRRGAATA